MSARPDRLRSRVITIRPIPPYRLDYTAQVLRRRAANIWDRWDGRAYRRVFDLGHGPVEARVEQTGPPDAPVLTVVTGGAPLPDADRTALVAMLRVVLGAQTDLTDFYRFADRDALLGPLAQRYSGFKPPVYPTLFEALANAIACQQITLAAGLSSLAGLVRRCGPVFARHGEDATYGFPSAPVVATLAPEELRALGYSRQKAAATLGAARAIGAGHITAGELNAASDEAAIRRLRELAGVGNWTAEYVLLRGFGRMHVYPGEDSGGRNNLMRWLGEADRMSYEAVRRTVERWHPWAGMVYLHLILDRIVSTEAGPSRDDARANQA